MEADHSPPSLPYEFRGSYGVTFHRRRIVIFVCSVFSVQKHIFLYVCNTSRPGSHQTCQLSSLFWDLGQRQLVVCCPRIATNMLSRNGSYKLSTDDSEDPRQAKASTIRRQKPKISHVAYLSRMNKSVFWNNLMKR